MTNFIDASPLKGGEEKGERDNTILITPPMKERLLRLVDIFV